MVSFGYRLKVKLIGFFIGLYIDGREKIKDVFKVFGFIYWKNGVVIFCDAEDYRKNSFGKSRG